jgi:non-homologous end joining protein Ku
MLEPRGRGIVEDPAQDRLLEIIAAKKAHSPPPKKEPQREAPHPRANIMDALRRSIEAETGTPQAHKRKPAARRSEPRRKRA